MKKKTYFIILGILVTVLIVAIILTITIKKPDDEYIVLGEEAKEYQKIYDISLINDAVEDYYVIKGLTKDNGVALRYIEYPSTIDGIKVKKIITNENRFGDYRNIQKIVISKYIEYIGTDLTAQDLGNCFFENAVNLTTIEVDEQNQFFSSKEGILYSKNMETLLKFPINKSISTEPFQINEKVKIIGNRAFLNAAYLKAVIISKNVEILEESAFYSCKQLSNIIFENESRLTKIGANCFRSANLIEKIELPNSVISLDSNAFYDCSSLKALFIPSSVKEFGTRICLGCNPEIKIFTPKENYDFLISVSENFGNKNFVNHIVEQ